MARIAFFAELCDTEQTEDLTMEHPAALQSGLRKLVYTAFSKHSFYLRQHITRFVLEQGGAPLNPFMSFDYFLLDTVDRDAIRDANNSLVRKADELWVFGPVADGVQVEIELAKHQGKRIRCFEVDKRGLFTEVDLDKLPLESGVTL